MYDSQAGPPTFTVSLSNSAVKDVCNAHEVNVLNQSCKFSFMKPTGNQDNQSMAVIRTVLTADYKVRVKEFLRDHAISVNPSLEIRSLYRQIKILCRF